MRRATAATTPAAAPTLTAAAPLTTPGAEVSVGARVGAGTVLLPVVEAEADTVVLTAEEVST